MKAVSIGSKYSPETVFGEARTTVVWWTDLDAPFTDFVVATRVGDVGVDVLH